MVQWLRLPASKTGGVGSIPDQVTKILHALGHGNIYIYCSPQLDGLPWSGQVHLKRLGRIMLDISKALNLDLFPEMTLI